MSRTRWLVTALSFLATFGASLYLIRESWPAERADVLLPSAVHLLLLAVTALEIASRGLKVMMSARSIGVPLSFTTSVRTVLGGDFGAALTPARSGAEPARFLVLAEAGTPAAAALVIMFIELCFEVVSLAVVALVLAVMFGITGPMAGALLGLVGGYALFVFGLGAALVVLAWRNASGPPPGWARRVGLNALRWRRVQRALRQLRTSVAGLREARLAPLVVSLAASTMHVLLRLAVLPIAVLALDPSVPVARLLLWPLALFYGGVVAPAPGGGGFIEVAFRAALGGTIPTAIFAASLIWWRFYTFYLYILLGALAAGRTVLRALRGNDEERREHHAATLAAQGAKALRR